MPVNESRCFSCYLEDEKRLGWKKNWKVILFGGRERDGPLSKAEGSRKDEENQGESLFNAFHLRGTELARRRRGKCRKGRPSHTSLGDPLVENRKCHGGGKLRKMITTVGGGNPIWPSLKRLSQGKEWEGGESFFITHRVKYLGEVSGGYGRANGRKRSPRLGRTCHTSKERWKKREKRSL